MLLSANWYNMHTMFIMKNINIIMHCMQ